MHDGDTATSVTDPDQNIEHKLIWEADHDTVRNDFVLRQYRQVNADTLHPEKLIKELNTYLGGAILVFRRISHDTMYVAIPDSEALTQRMGSYGAMAYIATATFNLTELRGIKHVNYDFEEGDHLSPGTMSRDDFKEHQ